jgi:hypothetical protein
VNYLSHQYIARRVKPEPGATALFFAGNLLPDLLSIAGDGRLRAVEGHTNSLADGVRLHLATDKAFHGLPAFLDAQAEATRILAEARWEIPLRRRFFIAHVMTELAMDSVVLARQPALPDDLYGCLSESLDDGLVEQTEALAGRPTPNLQATIERFLASRFLYQYATPAGLASSMIRIGRRTGISNFEDPTDEMTLAKIFADFTATLAPNVDDLLYIPPPETGGFRAPVVVQ